MKQIKISISMPMDNRAVHEHSALLPYNGDDVDIRAYDAIKHFLHLCQNVFGELDTQDAIAHVKKEW